MPDGDERRRRHALPTGWIADKVNGRLVLIGLSVLAIMASPRITLGIEPGMAGALILRAVLFGATSFPLNSVSAAYANEFAPEDFLVELKAALIFFFLMSP